ncbi:MAG: NUDIX hydrolase [Candidatus Bipolaricaulia bacterium]
MENRHPIVGVGAVIVNDGKVLLVQRGKPPGRGIWAIPGGRLRWGERLEEAVRREICEETGLEIELGEIAGVKDLIERDGSEIAYHYVLIDFYAKPIGGQLEPGSDALDARWVVPDLDHLQDYELSRTTTELLTELFDR